jgi:hypothetical protein
MSLFHDRVVVRTRVAQEQVRLAEQDAPLEFGHTLDDQIGGQLAAGSMSS